MLYNDDNSATQHVILASKTAGGIRVTRAVSYPVGNSGEYVTWRNYEVALEADLLDTNINILAWTEVLSFHGGGPQFVWLEPLNGAPQRQLLKQATTFHATQQGSAMGNTQWILAPAAIWPDVMHQGQSSVNYTLPKRSGPKGSPFYAEYESSWSYVFESGVPLTGEPTAQPEL